MAERPAIRGDTSRGESVFIVTLTTIVLTTVFVVGRLLSRFAIVRNHTWDDWFIILAWLIAFGLSFTICFGTKRGLGSRDVDIKEEWLPSLRRAQYAFTILYNPALMATKTSILIFYLRMSRNTQRLLRIASYATLGLVNVSGVVLTFLNAFQCTPPSAAYDIEKDNGRCINIITLYLCSSPVNIFCNLAILVLPIPVLTGMRLPQRQKTVLVFTFALGIFVTIVDVIRIYYLQKAVDVQLATIERFDSTVDFSWNSSLALMWSAVEVNIGIICACIPTLKPLIKKLIPSMIADRTRNNSTATEKTSLSSQNAQPNGGSHTAEVSSPTQLLPQSPAPIHVEHDQENQMGMMDFLTTPEDCMNRTATHMTTVTENTVYYGFVNMKKPKSMLKIKGKESFKYATLVTVLFFLWGFSYGLLNTLNNKISQISGQSTAQTLGLTSAYFGAYLFGALTVGQWVLRHAGFKATFIVGLCIYGTGTLMFWPSAVLRSFPGFVLSNFVVAFGLSILETAANPFLALCGPSRYSEYRLLLAQGVQAIGSVLSQLMAQRVLFRSVVSEGEASLLDVQWTYLGIALFDVILALLFYYSPLPEATDLELEQQSEDQGIYRSQTVFHPKLPLIYVTLGLAVFAQFCYVAGQESTSVWISPLLETLASQSRRALTLRPSDYVLVGHATFAVGRFLFAALSLIIAPRILLFVSLLGCVVFSVLATSIHSLDGNGIGAFVVMFFFFEGPVWPLIFAIGLRGLGKHTKIGAAILTASASGGGIFPFVMWAVQVVQGRSVQYSYVVNVALFAAGCIFPIYLNVVGKARKQVKTKGCEEDLSTNPDDGANTPIRRLSRRFSVMFSKIGGGKSSLDEGPAFEHRESRTDEKGQGVGFGFGMGRDTRDFASGDERSPTVATFREEDQILPMSAVFKRDDRLSAEDRIWGSWERDISPTRRDVERLRGNI